MVKGFMFQQQQQQPQQQQVMEENMSNLTSASGEASEIGTSYSQEQYLAPPTQTVKKKRNLPGNPDPEAEVIALSPKSLLAKNRFICEICNKGFQRDQNLQLHRRGHNLPWKLKQRTSKEIRKKVYVCPETTCVHHDPSRALGDLTGIKKHFCRKHGEKKWKCEKCSKKYAVQSDWKAHSKTCGTRENRCDCGTLFSRRDSFITHRAFCDALAEESARAMTNITIPNLPSHSQQEQPSSSSSHHMINLQTQFNNPQSQELNHVFQLKKEQQQQNQNQSFNLSEIPPWLGPPNNVDNNNLSSTSIFSQNNHFSTHHQENPNPSLVHVSGPTLPSYQTVPSPHMSATALLQKAAQMGATMNINGSASSPAMNIRTHQLDSDSLNNVSGAHFDEMFGGIMNSKKDRKTAADEGGGGGGGNEGLTRDFLGLRPLSHSDILSIAGIGNCMNDESQNQSQKPSWQG
ncbi:protein indeterminate-domain [Trifolium repens]|nr:protein indeterminate-domain [Trifolium repens]